MRLRRARYGDASMVELTDAAASTASVQTTGADESLERLRGPPVDRSSASDDNSTDDVEAEVDFGVADVGAFHVSP